MFVSLIAPGAIESSIWDKSREYKKELRKNADAELLDVYKLFVKAGDKMLDSIVPIPAVEVAKAVAHGLTSKKPKNVYFVGNDAKKFYILSKLPKRLKLEIRNSKKPYFNSLISNIQTCPYDQMEVRMDGFLISEHEFF
jgi:hypothetical protein